MHIFLTGPRGVGKTTIITRIVKKLIADGACSADEIAGFRTAWFDVGGNDTLYILPYDASAPGAPGSHQLPDIAARPVAERDAVRRVLAIHPEVFDEDGVAILRASGVPLSDVRESGVIPPDEARPSGTFATDTDGSDAYRQDARQSKFFPTKLIVMDELGFMESSAAGFRGAVMDALGGGVPVLGVLRLEGNPFLDAVKEHGRVSVVHVSESNRDMLFERLTGQVFRD
jgi:nucleoside-triphosphatase THEP1